MPDAEERLTRPPRGAVLATLAGLALAALLILLVDPLREGHPEPDREPLAEGHGRGLQPREVGHRGRMPLERGTEAPERQQRLVVDHLHEARRVALRRGVDPAVGVGRGDDQERRPCWPHP